MGGAKLPRPFDRWTTYPGHGGIDYGQPRGEAILAQADGAVTFAGYYSARGGFAVFVDYGRGFLVGNYHIDRQSDIFCKVGERVKYGDTLARVGSLGINSTGPHLHQEVWVNGTIMKPPLYWNYISKSENDYVKEDDMFSDSDRALLKRVDEAIRNGKAGSHSDGSVTKIIKSIQKRVFALDPADFNAEALAAELKRELPPAVVKAIKNAL